MKLSQKANLKRKGSRAKKLLAVSAPAALAALMVAPALAATPPQLPHDITIFPQRDMVAADGYTPNTRMVVTVRRAGTVVGRAIGTTDRTGFLEVNHPGGICWGAGAGAALQVTPDIQPEDVVTVNPADTASDSARTINVTAEAAFINTDGNVEVHGTAQNPNGGRIRLDRLEQRIIQPDFRVDDPDADPNDSNIGRRDIRADSTGGRVDNGNPDAEGNLSYDPIDPATNPNGINWTAVYTGLNDAEAQLAVEGQTRVLSWMQTTNAGDRLGLTIYEEDEINGPGFGGCPAGPGPAVLPVAPNAPLLYDSATQKYNAADSANHVNLLDAAVPGTDLTQLHEVVVFPERDFVVAEGYAPGANLEFVVRRPGVGIIGSAVGVTGRDGLLEVNHPGGEEWTGQTPEIIPGDIVDIVQFDDPDGSVAADVDSDGDGKNGDEVAVGGETLRTINVTAQQAFINNAGNVQVNGTARNPSGRRIPLAQLEQRIIQPDFRDGPGGSNIGRRDIRADSEGGRVDGTAGNPVGEGNLRYTTGNKWRAVYTGLNGPAKRLAVEGQTRILSWLGADAAGERFGITIFEVGELGGPGMGGAPPAGNESLPVIE